MKYLRHILLWSLCLLLLAGCTGEPTPAGTPTESSLPSPAAGITLETTRLSVEPWNSGRLAQCDQFRSGETEAGFYFAYMGMLYYGDKSDLRLWVPVCPDPDCDHTNFPNECKAVMDAAFVLRDGRIYHLTPKNDGTMDYVPIFKTPVASMAPDGSDGRLEYVVGGLETSVTAGSGTRTTMLTDRWCLEYSSFLNEEGAFDVKLVLLDETGEYILARQTQEESKVELSQLRRSRQLFGDPAFTSRILDPEGNKVWRISGQELYAVEVGDLPLQGGYLSGDMLWCFRPGQGYYAVNLTTGEETKLAECRVENSVANIVLPNCILESDLLGTKSQELRQEGEPRYMWFFDGAQWREVALPEEVQTLDETGNLDTLGVASDRILLLLRQGTGSDRSANLCQILLNTDVPTLEILGALPLTRGE